MIPKRHASDSGDLDQERIGEDRDSLHMDKLSRVVREKLIDIIERSPDAFSDGEEDWDLLGGSKQVVETSTGKGQIDG